MPSPHPDNLTIEREEAPNRGRYFITLDGDEAEMTYSRREGNAIVIDHTYVPEALRGRSIGESLVRRAVMDAREEGRSIVPLCPFVKAKMARHTEWQDVLKHQDEKGDRS